MIPDTMLAWQLYGAGMENFGREGRPAAIPVPEPGGDEVLMRVEAIGLCFSDVKLIKAGEEHPRVVVNDLKKEPVTPGHEAVLRVVKAGAKMATQFKPGQRYIIQAEIHYKGVNLAYGYALNGGMAQYSLMTDPILRGDAGCYLLPISDRLSAAEAALIEPWTCVIAAYRIPLRTTVKNGGLMRVIGDGAPSNVTCGGLITAENKPAKVVVQNVAGPFRDEMAALGAMLGFAVVEDGPGEDFADDLVITGAHSDAQLEKYAAQLNTGGVLCLAGEYQDSTVQIDVGRVHYKAWKYYGTTLNNLADAYTRNARSVLRKGGVAWFPGGAGAMGQMHVQLALECPQTPRKIVVTDLDDTRLRKLEQRLAGKIREKGVEFVAFNPKRVGDERAVAARLTAEAPDGFDDIVMLVPVPALIGVYSRFLGTDGLMNVFAGVPVGSMAPISLGAVASKGARYLGSSGSSMEDIGYTLRMTEEGKLSPIYALGAIGGMMSLKEGIEGVMTARYPGKTVIYPNAIDMPLVPIEHVDQAAEGASKTLLDGEVFTKATEEMLKAKWEGKAGNR